MPKAQETLLEIDLSALEKNYDYLKSKLKPDTKFLGVVKAFAYGSDSVAIAKKLQDLGADYLAVAYFSEGELLRDNEIIKPILVLHPQVSNFKNLIERCLEPNIYSLKTLNSFVEIAEAENQRDYPIHIKFNTGLNRLGFVEKEIEEIHSILKNTEAVKVKSIFSHLAASEDLDEIEYSENQINKFKKYSQKLTNELGYRPMYHMLNTSGILNYPEAQFDMVRSGIGLYGFGNSDEYKGKLIPIATLKSVISQKHHIEKGQTIGYNRAYKSEGSMITATIPIGHADGIGRQYGNKKGYVVINKEKAFMVGNVCMDMIMVDVTDIECEEGDEVVVFGKDNNASDFASTAKTISYEILTAISQRVKRKIIE